MLHYYYVYYLSNRDILFIVNNTDDLYSLRILGILASDRAGWKKLF